MGRTLTGGSQPPLPQPPAAVRTGLCGGLFTAADLAAAQLLVHLSESSADTASAISSSSSSSSTPRSVNTRPPDAAVLGGIDDEEEMGPWQRTKRYRPMVDLYAATRPVGGGGGGGEERQSRPHHRPGY